MLLNPHITQRPTRSDAVVNLAAADLKFPVLCLTTQYEIWSAHSLPELTTWSKYALRPRKAELGMELVDRDGRRFVVSSIHIRRKGPLSWVLALGDRMRQVDFDLTLAEPLSLEQLKARFVSCVRDKPLISDSYRLPPKRDHPLVAAGLAWVAATTAIEDFSDGRWVYSIREYIGPGGWTIADLRPPFPKGRIALFGGGFMGS